MQTGMQTEQPSPLTLMSALKKTTLFASLAMASTAVYSVPLVDFRVTAGQWQADYSGDIGVRGNSATLDELGFEEEDHNLFEAVLKHPVPGLPNVKLKHSDITTDANATLTRTFQIDDLIFVANEDVATEIDITHTDFTLFYSPVNNWAQLDIGLTARNFDAEATVTGSVNGTESEDFDGVVPMLYLGARFELPLTGLYVDATLNTISFEEAEISDLTTAIGYAFDLTAVDLVAELGYRNFGFKLDEEETGDIEVDIELDGIYFNLGLAF